MNKIKELTEKLKDNYHLEHTYHMSSAFSKDTLLKILKDRETIMIEACKEHERLIDLSNELLVKVEDKYKDLMEEIVWEKMQQLEMTKKEVERVQNDVKSVLQNIVKDKSK